MDNSVSALPVLCFIYVIGHVSHPYQRIIVESVKEGIMRTPLIVLRYPARERGASFENAVIKSI